MDRPNFLLIMTDQQRADHLGCSGHPILRTPNIDSIANDGRLPAVTGIPIAIALQSRRAQPTPAVGT